MGHDIYAFKGVKTEEQIAYLRRNASSKRAHLFYDALQANDHDCGVSGCGTGKYFLPVEIQRALSWLRDQGIEEDEEAFLTACLTKASGVTIIFS